MKVPFPANTQTTTTTSKPLSLNPTTTHNTFPTATAVSYEPKSVLDLRRSPSPVAEKPVPNNNDVPLSDHALINQHLAVDWDSLMRELGLNDDSTPIVNKTDHYSPLPDQLPHVNTSFDPNHFLPSDFGLLSDNNNNNPTTYPIHAPVINNNSFHVGDFDYVDELIRLAECFETNSIHLGHAISARLDQRLTTPNGKPLQRAAFYFKQALQSLLTGSTTRSTQTSSEIVQTIKAQKMFATVSPIPLFASFTANQAVMEALDGGGSTKVHVIDFDIGLGGHWASFMKELGDTSRLTGVRISAVVFEEYGGESRLVRENLSQFARELNIRLEVEFVSIRNFEYLSFKSIRLVEGEKVAVVLSPAIFGHVGTGFVNDMRRVSPHVVVHVGMAGESGGTASYREAVIEGLEFYSTLLETLDDAASLEGGDNWVRRIEEAVVFPRIVEAAGGRRGAWWREAMVAAGLRQVGPSQFAEFQAECLLRRVQVRGFHVVRRQAEMLLCWHDRPIVATSAWRY